MWLNLNYSPLAINGLGPFCVFWKQEIYIVVAIIQLVRFHHVSLKDQRKTIINKVIGEQVREVRLNPLLNFVFEDRILDSVLHHSVIVSGKHQNLLSSLKVVGVLLSTSVEDHILVVQGKHLQIWTCSCLGE